MPHWLAEGFVQIPVYFKVLISLNNSNGIFTQLQECTCREIMFGSVDEILSQGPAYDEYCSRNSPVFDTKESNLVNKIQPFRKPKTMFVDF